MTSTAASNERRYGLWWPSRLESDMVGLSVWLYPSSPSRRGMVRRTRGIPRDGDRRSLCSWTEHACSRVLCFCFAFLSLSRCRVRYLDMQVISLSLSLSLSVWLCAWAILRSHEVRAAGESRWRGLRDNPLDLVAKLYCTAVSYDRTVRVQPRGARPPDLHQPNSGPPAGCTTREEGALTPGRGAPLCMP